jgi:alkylhydroperoxidase family enzyme
VLLGADDDLPPREAALVRFATKLTATPWAVQRADVDTLRELGLDEAGVEAAIGVVAVFNYLTRVADASGIEFDYDSPLPKFEVHHARQPAPRPPRTDGWPVVGAELLEFPSSPILQQAWKRWRELVFASDEPLDRRQRALLARVAAEESCDAARAEELSDFEARDDAEDALAAFGRKLARAPWQMTPGDLDTLRAAGFPEVALLHAIAVTALQSAESRVRMARAAALA